MKKKIEDKIVVTISMNENVVTVANDKNTSWTFKVNDSSDLDVSNCAFIGQIASGMLTATIASHVKHLQFDTLKYTLQMEQL